MSSPSMPAVALAAVPGRRRATLDLAREIERREFSGIYCASFGDGLGLCEALAFATEHIPFGTQRSGLAEPGSSAPISAQHTCVLGSHRAVPQKMPDVSELVTSGFALPESAASGFEVLASAAPTSGPAPSGSTVAPSAPPLALPPVDDVVVDVDTDTDDPPPISPLLSDASCPSVVAESPRTDASS